MRFPIRFCYSHFFTNGFTLKLFYLLIIFHFLLSFLIFKSIADSSSFYDLLNVAKDADLVEIRRNFKKLAIKYHPDKNKDDPNAHEKFVQINRAYEVLKDDELRKKYDTFGEEGLKEGGPRGQHYENWHFYNEQFGIYDEDPEIVTLSASDFEQLVLNGGGAGDQRWFINFYSAHCSHCHHLAPAWREMAKRVQGAFRIGAVNCLDDFIVCNRENIRSYPSLMIYPQRIYYQGRRDAASLVDFVLSQISSSIDLQPNLNIGNYKGIFSNSIKPVLLMFHQEEDLKLTNEKRLLLAANLENLVDVYNINCASQIELCKVLGNEDFSDKIVFHERVQDLKSGKILDSLDVKEIVNQVLTLLPDFTELEISQFTEIRDKIASSSSPPWLIEFVDKVNDLDAKNLEFRKLPQLLENRCKVGRLNCSKFQELCLQRLKLSPTKFPLFALFKNSGGFEIYYGRRTAYDLASFASESIQTNVRSLGPDDSILLSLQHPSKISSEENAPWFLDFFAPWCPPCMKLLPEFRKASKQLQDTVNFGTIDCTVHQNLCSRLNINSYPTTIFYNQSKPHPFLGYHTHTQLIEFVEDIKNPPVYTLTSAKFKEMVLEGSQMWVVDFFNPHCHPCQQLAPEFRKSAKMMKEHEDIVNFGQVDCLQEQMLCEQEYIRAYPTIRLYWTNRRGYTDYQQWYRDAHSISQWVYTYMPSTVDEISGEFFTNEILYSSTPYLVDFFAPWCGHCHEFAPEYEKVSKALQNRVKVVKMNCDLNQQTCISAGIRGYPTVKFYKGSKTKDGDDAENGEKSEGMKQHPFGEEITSQNVRFIVSFIEKRLKSTVESTATQQKGFKDEL